MLLWIPNIPLAGTIFEKTTTPLQYWFYAMFIMTVTRSGVSAKQLQRELGVTYKTAWRMMKQIRILMAQVDKTSLSGTVEIDETYMGGKSTNRRYKWGKSSQEKEAIMGMIERNGRAYLKHVPDTYNWTLFSQIKENVDPKARVVTDQLPAYMKLGKMGYNHDHVNHAKTYVVNDIHTQNIESMWSGLKRGVYGVYRHVSAKYLQAYVDEYTFRYNNRKSVNMFDVLLRQVAQVRVVK